MIIITPGLFLVTSAEQMVTGTIQAEPDVEWEVTSTADWIEPVVATGRGAGRFTVQAASNLCGDGPRVAHIRVKPGPHYVPIEQSGSDLGLCPSIDRTDPERRPPF